MRPPKKTHSEDISSDDQSHFQSDAFFRQLDQDDDDEGLEPTVAPISLLFSQLECNQFLNHFRIRKKLIWRDSSPHKSQCSADVFMLSRFEIRQKKKKLMN
jgi:hypothetical protein